MMEPRRKFIFVAFTWGSIWAVCQIVKGQTEPECRTYVGPESFLDLQPELDLGLQGGLIIFGEDQEVNQSGLLTRWFFVTDSDNGTFWLDVWRPVSTSLYKLVKSREVNVSTSGFHVIELMYGQRFEVQPGDRFGIHFRDVNTTITQMGNTSALCYSGFVEDTPNVSGQISTSSLTAAECSFALRASIASQKDPCGHLYDGLANQGIRTERTISTFADTLGVCSLKCLHEQSCVGFTFRKVITVEGYRVNVCDLNCARLADDVDTIPDDGNYTDYIHFN